MCVLIDSVSISQLLLAGSVTISGICEADLGSRSARYSMDSWSTPQRCWIDSASTFEPPAANVWSTSEPCLAGSMIISKYVLAAATSNLPKLGVATGSTLCLCLSNLSAASCAKAEWHLHEQKVDF